MRTNQQKIIDFMMKKTNCFDPEDRNLYFNNDDKIDIMYWSNKKSQYVINELIENIIFNLNRSIYEGFTPILGEICPFCIIYLYVENGSCKKCTYRKRHGICNKTKHNDFNILMSKYDICYTWDLYNEDTLIEFLNILGKNNENK
jgi:hypothetical protein